MEERASVGVILGVAGGVLLLVACVGVPLGFGPRTLAASDALAQHYDLGALPFGFHLQPVLHVLPAGERVYVLNADDFVPEKLEHFEFKSPRSHGPPAPDAPLVDWSKIEALSSGSPPDQLFLVEYPLNQAESVIAGQFRALEWKQLSEIDAGGGRSAVDGGKIEWNGYMADFVRQREFRPGLRFVDQVRVNLSLRGECWIAYAVWPEQHTGSTEPVEELLGALRPLE